MKRALRSACCLLGLAILVTAAPAAAELYRWTDGDGALHYTADLLSIPERYRGSVETVGHPQARPAAPRSAEPTPTTGQGANAPFSAATPIVVTARLNGVSLSLIVDTGADRTVISPAALARAGLVGDAASPIRIVGVTGSSDATIVTIPLLDVAGARVGPLRVVVHQIPAEGVDGLLGRDVLEAFTLTVDSASGRATLVPR